MSDSIERYVIKHISGSKANQVEQFDFKRDTLSIGRVAEADIQFDAQQDLIVSREHGKIVRDSTEPLSFTIHDNNSRNGIFINKSRVKGASKLNIGDEVQLGNNGPAFVFDVDPRPHDLMMTTRMVEIPTTIKPTSVSAIEELPPVSEPQTSLGKQTVERMLKEERKHSFRLLSWTLGGVVLITLILGYSFRKKLFGGETQSLVAATQTNKKTVEQIFKENEDKVVQIEFSWQLYDVTTNEDLWHIYKSENINNVLRERFLYIRNGETIQPYIERKSIMLKYNMRGEPIGMPSGAIGSGFIVSEDGFILTNRHIGTGWNTKYEFYPYAFPGDLIDANGKTVCQDCVMPGDLANWVPAKTKMIGTRIVKPGTIQGKNNYINVVFAGTSLRRPASQAVTASDNHDVALLKVEIPESLQKVEIKDKYNQITPGQEVVVIGYPAVSPTRQRGIPSNDPFDYSGNYASIPTPTVTPGNIGKVIPASSSKDLIFSPIGDSYQLTINATGAGNSGGPLFDEEGNVVGIFFAGMSDQRGTQITFALPIKYGLEIMGRKKIANSE